jgi:hypothetical protein
MAQTVAFFARALQVAVEQVCHGAHEQRDPVLRRRSVAKLINQQQRSLGRIAQHGRNVREVLRKGALGEIDRVDRRDRSEDAVGQRDRRVVCRHERSDVRHQRDQSDLLDVDRLAGVVRPCQNLDQPRLRVALRAVRDEGVDNHLLQDVPTVLNDRLAILGDDRAAEPQVLLRKTAFLSHLYIKTIILPRQARDKHRENSKKDAVFPTAAIASAIRQSSCAASPEIENSRSCSAITESTIWSYNSFSMSRIAPNCIEYAIGPHSVTQTRQHDEQKWIDRC